MNRKQTYRYILDTVPIPIFEVDEHLIIRLANKEAHQRWSTIEEGKSHFCRALRCEEEGPGHSVIEKTFQLKKSHSAEVETRAGEIFEIKTNYVEDIKKGTSRAVVHILDITAHKKTANALRESEEKYRTIFELSPETIALLDKDGKLVDINERLSGTLGYKREDYLGKNFLELPFFTGENKGKAKEAFIQKMQGKDVPPYDLELTSLSGGKIICSIVSTLIKNTDGQVTHDLVMISDITKRKRAEEELKKHRDHLEELVKERTAELSEANKGLKAEIAQHEKTEAALREAEKRYRRMVECNPGPIVVHAEGKVAYVNDAGIKMVGGHNARQLIGKSVIDFVHPDYREMAGQRIRQILKDGKEAKPMEEKFLRLDGRIIDVEVTGIPITYNGKPSVQLMLNDITERKQAEQALAETNLILGTILDFTHMLVAYLDPRFNFVRVNRAYAEADEREPSFFPGKNHFDLFPNSENEAIFRRVVETGEPYFTYAKAFEYAENPERGITYWDWSLIPIKNGEKEVTGLVLTLVDVSKRIEVEEQIKSSLAEKDVLLKEIHHRVKNNLQLINSLLNLQARRIPDEKNRSPFEECKNRINSIALVHEKIYESNDLAKINFGEYLRTLTTQFFTSHPARLSHIDLKMEVEDIFLPVNQAIPCALIVNELLSNSIKYAFPPNQIEKGKITIQFKSAEDGKATLIAADNGIGLPDGFNIHTSDTLGMHIIAALVRQLHASVQADGKKGTTFTVQFQIHQEKK